MCDSIVCVAREAQTHPWLLHQNDCSGITIHPIILSRLREFKDYNKLKKAALTAVAYHLNNVSALRASWL